MSDDRFLWTLDCDQCGDAYIDTLDALVEWGRRHERFCQDGVIICPGCGVKGECDCCIEHAPGCPEVAEASVKNGVK